MASARKPSGPTRRSGPEETMEVGEAVFQLFRTVGRHCQEASREVGLTAPQGKLLLTLAHQGSAVPSDLARKLSLSRQALSSAARHLEAEGVVVRRRNGGDRRRVHVEFTPKGRRRLETFLRRIHEIHRRVDAEFSPAERRAAVRMIRRIGDAVSPEGMDEAFLCPACRPAGMSPRRDAW